MTENRISDFSRRFSAALQGVMREHGVRVGDVAEAAGRSKGYVSEHTSGKAAPDTDLLDAIAEVIGYDTRALVSEITRRIDIVWPDVKVEVDESKVSPTIRRLDEELERRRSSKPPVAKAARSERKK